MRLFEVFTHGEGEYLLAHKEHIWLYDSYTSTVDENPRYEELLEILGEFGLAADGSWQAGEVVHGLDDIESPIIVAGTVRGNELHMISNHFSHSTASSTVLNILKKLNLGGVYYDFYEGDYEVEFYENRWEFLQPLSNKTFYHGTSTKYLDDILRLGLVPTSTTNYGKINHHDLVFVTTNYGKALSHAANTAYQTKSQPVVFSLTVPDLSKLVLDYDVALQQYGTQHPLTLSLGYTDIADMATGGRVHNHYKKLIQQNVPKELYRQVADKSSLNTKLGSFGYRGRISPTQIDSIYSAAEIIVALAHEKLFGENFLEQDDIDVSNLTQYSIEGFRDQLLWYIEQIEEECEEDDDEY